MMMSEDNKGIKFDQDKPDYSLLPFAAMDDVVRVLTYGAKKYDRFNWRNVERHRYEAAALRHISAYKQGEIMDPETGLNHLAHAMCSLLFLMEFDRIEQKKPSEKKDVQMTLNFTRPMYNYSDMVYNNKVNEFLDKVSYETK
jgi:hypothetical protein